MSDKEKYKNARAFIVLLAALITWILNLKYSRDLNKSLVILLVVIIVFYIIATIAIKLIDKIKNMENKVETIEVPQEEGEDTETEEA